MKVYYTDRFVLPLPEGHRFPMRKYSALRQRVQRVAPELMLEPAPASDAELALAHDPKYVARVTRGELSAQEIRRIGFPWSSEMVERSRRSAGATIAACRSALDEGCAVNLAGGTHHAYRDHGEGYCVFNDTAVSCRLLQFEGRVRRAVVIDLDVHQGNGTASIFAGDSSIFAFSMHGRNNYPFRKESSTLDIELDDGTGDDEYLQILRQTLPQVLDRARADLAIYLAGADPYQGDRLGRLALTRGGLAARDRFVLECCRERDLPVAITMAGGYAESIEDIVDIHFATVSIALELFYPPHGTTPSESAT